MKQRFTQQAVNAQGGIHFTFEQRSSRSIQWAFWYALDEKLRLALAGRKTDIKVSVIRKWAKDDIVVPSDAPADLRAPFVDAPKVRGVDLEAGSLRSELVGSTEFVLFPANPEQRDAIIDVALRFAGPKLRVDYGIGAGTRRCAMQYRKVHGVTLVK